ncbi:2-oxoglutarate dehydrogenase E1 component [Anaeromyxobacter paludicola]|uniref:oxoglutarate dehydrogenase (succinyl-transferring) n=1 Tax=Anaeromyxobacter paludicola TaxID=2918171 RepID=A0ABM7XF97_9BACT|nr:2-oxoglutarate dehydrogenase E1 component [Anaeromyxobacter paludicola]BDG10502.1 2-oxoglutarate dehydrogenase E1 component [Anaeromyxobacter paludicola]
MQPVPESATAPSAANLAFVEELYYDYLRDPSTVPETWRRYFDALPRPEGDVAPPPEPAWRRNGFTAALPGELAAKEPPAGPGASSEEAFQFRVDKLVETYRDYGHLRARLDPLGLARREHQGFGLESFGLREEDLARPVAVGDPQAAGATTLGALRDRLEETYCRTLGVELAHLHDQELRGWLQDRMERTRNHITLAPEVQLRLYQKVMEAELLEQFLGTRFLGAKRFSVEGGESTVALLELAIDRAVGHGVRDVTIGMAHRGRLNVLANVCGKPLRQIFAEFRDRAVIGGNGGDVKYHLGFTGERETPDGKVLVTLAFNPSHLEWVNTVVQGRVRAKQDRRGDVERKEVLPLLVHGDAAFAGQGIVAEALNLAALDGYTVGGTVHVVVNNQVGFTTSPADARSTTYATDVARMLQIPVFHVNGEDMEAVAQAVLLAVDFRQRFHRDAVIDLWCYRRHGHNEGDEPSFTQPVMYRAIAGRETFPKLEAARLVRERVATAPELDGLAQGYRARLEEAFHASAAIAASPSAPVLEVGERRYRGGAIDGAPPIATAVSPEVIAEVSRALVTPPPGFNVHPKVAKLLEGRAQMAAGHRPLDWGMAEALAYGTLAWEGTRVRLSGQDSRRGTFSHRHGVLYDTQSNRPYTPLAHLRPGQGVVELRDSPLSEAAVLAFDYGYSLDMPDGLVIWEAQFGDFVNAAQVVIDQFLSSSEAKWNKLSGLTLLLPHGMEGQGPEHSSARLERFLALSVDDNWQVVNLTTPAQIFHALRRQVLAPWRKPLVVMSPKSLLRHPQAVSPVEALSKGGFQPVLGDAGVEDAAAVTRVLLCTGKLYYELLAAREAQRARHVALVRVEQLYPLDRDAVLSELARYPDGLEVVWVQEEPRNMGAWDYVDLHLGPFLRGFCEFSCVSRPPSAAPAAGSATRHKLEQQALVAQAIGVAARVEVA